MDNRDENLFEKVNQLKTVLGKAATGTHFPEIEDEYQELRAYLISTNIGSRLPEFVYSCRELIDFWDFIKNELRDSRYTDRRKFLNEKFQSLLTELEIGLSNPGGQPIMPPKEGSTSIKPYCFVIMSFSDNPELEDVYKLGIKSIVEELGFECIRVDEIEHNRRITDVIIEQIENATFVIAELTEEKPNCYYEIGYAHALKKNVIPVLKKGNDIPFDLKDYNFIIYRNTSELRERLKKRIEGTVQEADSTEERSSEKLKVESATGPPDQDDPPYLSRLIIAIRNISNSAVYLEELHQEQTGEAIVEMINEDGETVDYKEKEVTYSYNLTPEDWPKALDKDSLEVVKVSETFSSNFISIPMTKFYILDQWGKKLAEWS